MVDASHSPAPLLTTVMYHYVRPITGSDFPRLKALDLAAFTGQLDHLQAKYSILAPTEIAAALDAGVPLPERACLLTFDDGYADHYRHVFPELLRRRLSALFFAPKASLLDRRMLEVNRIQFTLAAHPKPEALADEIDALLMANGFADIAGLRGKHFAPNRFDGAKVAYTKRLLQHALPAALRDRLTAHLFARHVTEDEAGFAEALYLTVDEARDMQAQGMVFGGHGDRHLWHGLASAEELDREVVGSVAALTAIGAPVQSGFYCYPFGSESEAVREAVTLAGFRTGFTVVPELWPSHGDRLRIARLDTNDLPHHPVHDDPWLLRAGGAVGMMRAGG